MKKKWLAVLLAALLLVTLGACGREGVSIPASQGGGEDFQKSMHQAGGFGCWLTDICETDTGYYFDYGLLYYMEKATGRVTVVCGKPDCDHTGEDCNARIGAQSLWQYGDKLYYIADDYTVANGKRVEDYGRRVFSLNLDGTGRKVVQDLDFEVGGDTSFTVTTPIFHQGNIYFSYSGVLYRVALGADLAEAEVVWQPESQQEPDTMFGIPVYTGNEPSYDLWADGDLVYFMVNLQQPDGVYRDTLFAYDPDGGEPTQVWVTPTAEVVGESESTVDDGSIQVIGGAEQVDRWYVKDGYIYFFLSMNGLWRCSLETGEYEKLADTTDKIEYGTAIFSDDYLCVLNDRPEWNDFLGKLSIGSPIREGGDTIYVYKLDGTFVKALPLTALTDKTPVLGSFLLFTSGSTVCFLADAGIVTKGDPITQGNFMVSGDQKETRYLLCSLDIDTGEITQACEFDH